MHNYVIARVYTARGSQKPKDRDAVTACARAVAGGYASIFLGYDRIAKSRSGLTGAGSLQLRGALGYAICVKDAIWFEPMSLLRAGETGRSHSSDTAVPSVR